MYNRKLKTWTIPFIGLALMIAAMVSCTGSLDVTPPDEDVLTSAQVFDTPNDFRQVLAKLYAGLSLTGQQGPAGDPDIQGIDEGFSNYVRQLWVAQQLPTDEAIVAWNDPGLPEFNTQQWGASNDFVLGMYSRIFFQITLTNEFIKNAQDREEPEIQAFNAEARFLRALSYWHALDLYGGNVPFVTEEDEIGAFLPEQTNAQDLFSFIESELLEIEDQLPAPGQNQYGRADRGALWTLLTKLYLNAEVYIGEPRFTDAITFASKVIDEGGYSLEPEYAHLFLADNHLSDGIIFPVPFDGINSRTFGGTTFITHAAIGGDMIAADLGVDVGWAGHRVTKQFVDNFIDIEQIENNSASAFSALNAAQDYPEIFVPGSFQTESGYGSDWSPEDAPALASVNSDDKYEGYVYFGSANTEFKFTDERSFDLNWGDNEGDGVLEENGANIVAADPGYYLINVDLNNLTYTLTRTEWGVIGDATIDGWDADQDMTYDVANKVWTITTDLTVGAMKFRANDDWVINFGDDDGDGVLEFNGGNIQISEPGPTLITLELGAPPFTFTTERTSIDSREMFFTENQTLEIEDVRQFNQGFAITKWKNLTRDGQQGKDPTFTDNDFPMFRLADVHLMYAEAVLRGGSGGDMGRALQLVNQVRERAFGDTSGNITPSELTLRFILDERARELYWEAHRRTDLRRYGFYTGGGLVWAWKGGVQEGTATADFLNIYPIPSSEINANPNLVQNPGY